MLAVNAAADACQPCGRQSVQTRQIARVHQLGLQAPAKPELTQAQRILLKARPAGMPAKQRKLYDRAVKEAWWLEPIDAAMLRVWASMTALAHEAGIELDRRLEDPAFADPKSTVSKEGQAYSRLWYRYTAGAIEAARQLGFTPRSRRQLGLD